MIYKFQSTLPARGATDFLRSHHAEPKDFNPRSPHGERLHADNSWACAGDFNPRSPHGERRPCAAHQAAYQHDFNPRSPHGERHDIVLSDFGNNLDFNPRSPHGERRKGSRWSRRALRHFNPRSPHGERQVGWMRRRWLQISIHAPRTGSDSPLQFAR